MSIILNGAGNPRYATYNTNRVQHIRYNGNPVWFEYLSLGGVVGEASQVICISESAHIYGSYNNGQIYILLNNIHDRFIKGSDNLYHIQATYSAFGTYTTSTALDSITLAHVTGINGQPAISTNITIMDLVAESQLAPGSGLQRRRYYAGPFIVGYNTGTSTYNLD